MENCKRKYDNHDLQKICPDHSRYLCHVSIMITLTWGAACSLHMWLLTQCNLEIEFNFMCERCKNIEIDNTLQMERQKQKNSDSFEVTPQTRWLEIMRCSTWVVLGSVERLYRLDIPNVTGKPGWWKCVYTIRTTDHSCYKHTLGTMVPMLIT